MPPAPAPVTTISNHPQEQQQQPQQYTMTTYSQQAIIPAFLTEEANNSIESLETSSMSDTSWQTPPPSVDSSSNGKGRPRSNFGTSGTTSNGQKTRRNVGGRKPNKPSNLSPEEEEKRRVRRERNKQAAARCRRRREDHTQASQNELKFLRIFFNFSSHFQDLQKQVDDMEEKKRQLTAEIQQMNQLRDELCEMIDEHKRSTECIVIDTHDVKPKVTESLKMTHLPTIPTTSLQRPNNFGTNLNNNNNNLIVNANNNKLAIKIKAEPIEDLYEDEPPAKKRCEM